MKSTSLFIAAFLIVVATVAAIGKEEPSKGLAIVPVKGSEVFKVIYRGEASNKVKLNLYNSQSTLVFSETINASNGFIRPLNFAGLTAGEYTVELVNGSEKKTEKISYHPVKSNAHVRVTKITEEGKYMVSVANTNETVSLRIYNSSNALLYSESKKVDGSFAQLYTIKNLTGVTFEVTDTAGNVKTVRF